MSGVVRTGPALVPRPRPPDRGRDLARRREVLLLRSARLRDELIDDVGELRHGLRHVDRGVSFARSGLLVLVAVGVGVVMLVGRPSRILRVAGRVLAFWPLIRPWVPRLVALALAARERSVRGG
jgi:hypothetical protein